MPSFGVPGASELIRTILRLQESIDELAKKKEEVKVNVSLGDELKASSSPGVKATVLDRIGRSKQAGAASGFVLRSAQEYRRRTEQARRLREQARTIQEQRQQLHRQRVRMLQGGTSPNHPRFQANVDRERTLQRRLNLTERRLRWERHRAHRAVNRGEEAASSGMAMKLRREIGEGVREGFKAAFKVGMGAYQAAKEVTGQAYVNLHRYGGYSAGGARALATEEIGNTLRAIRISRMTAESAQQFADASQKFKNALEPTMIGIINVTNRIAAGLLGAGANVANGAGQVHPGVWAGLGAAVGGVGALGMGAMGARLGMPFGPLGMAIGGLGGAGLGAAGAWWFGGQVNKDIADNQAKLKKMQEELGDENKRQWMGLAGPPRAPKRGAGPAPRRGGIAQPPRRRKRADRDKRMAEAFRADAERKRRLNPNKPNSKQILEEKRAREERRKRKREADERRLWGEIRDRNVKIAELNEYRGMVREWQRNAGELRNKRRHRPLSEDEAAELRGYERHIKEFEGKIKEIEKWLRENHQMHVKNDNMRPNILTAGVDIGWAMTPANPALRGGPTAPRWPGGLA